MNIINVSEYMERVSEYMESNLLQFRGKAYKRERTREERGYSIQGGEFNIRYIVQYINIICTMIHVCSNVQ